MSQLNWITIVIPLTATVIAGISDLWRFRVYNALTIPLFISGLVYHASHGYGPGLTSSVLGALFGFAVLIVPFALGLMGAGDVKLLTAVGAWMGLTVNVMVFVASTFASGLFALVLIVLRGQWGESWKNLRTVFRRLVTLDIAAEGLVEPLTTKADRRVRVIPFASMLPIGIVSALYWLR